MSKKKTPVRVKIKPQDRKKQKWTVAIDDVGPGPDWNPKARFASQRNAWRSALRKLKARTELGNTPNTTSKLDAFKWFTPDGHPIVRVLA